MNFTYETQGAITYLVCELDEGDIIDTLTLGMLTNNHIAGFAPVIYTEMNGCRFLKYNISAKLTAGQFFGGNINRQRTLLSFKNILTAICSADEYMIDPNCFSVNFDHVFLNVSSCETAMVCIPVVTNRDVKSDAENFFKQIMSSSQFDPSEDSTYITAIIAYVNNSAEFSVYGLKDLVENLLAGTHTVQNFGAPQGFAPAYVQPNAVPQTQPPATNNYTPPVTDFNSTISIDDMPAMMEKKKQIQEAQETLGGASDTPVQGGGFTAPPIHTGPAIKPEPNVMTPSTMTPPKNMGGFNSMNVPPAGGPQTMAGGMNVPPVGGPQTRPGGMNVPSAGGPQTRPGGMNVPPAGGQTPVNPPAAAKEGKEKKGGFLGLFSGRKKQKPEPKVQNIPNAGMPPQNSGMAPQNGGMPPQNGGMPPQNGGMAPQTFTPAQQVTPIPVQNSFNETTVLSPGMLGGGETTVLNAAPQAPDPHFIRIKTGEKISINKPVFRIGKEKSYVDFFIGDNTAISRSHCNIHSEGGEYFVEDTNSTNHTYVNGKIITSNVKVKLASGDKVKLANEEFIFSV